MKQTKLFKRDQGIKPVAADFDRRNLECAQLILADPDSYGGRESFAVIWARAVLDRLGVAE